MREGLIASREEEGSLTTSTRRVLDGALVQAARVTSECDAHLTGMTSHTTDRHATGSHDRASPVLPDLAAALVGTNIQDVHIVSKLSIVRL